MGAKTGLLAYTTGGIADALRNRPAEHSQEAAEAFVRRLNPGWRVSGREDPYANLCEMTYPPDDIAYAASLPGADILCSRTVMLDRPSELPTRYLEAAEGRTVILHAMHSVVDFLAFAIWKDGVLIRSLSLSPDSGIIEDIGERLPFEGPYWSGEHPVEPFDFEPLPGRPGPDAEPYPLPFHPLELGEQALRALFGFVIEGYPAPDDIDAFEVPMYGFDLIDPAGQTPEERQAERDALAATMGPPRMLQMRGGTLVEVEIGELGIA
ncbi:hypothetical protein ABH920_003721 [Catenulispora sp. EB89]|uniref:DUF6928 family protein n=1 Tax=Catenulispora sp. EB89 TaxID=3156257 RepID=UPI003511FCAC